MAMIDKLVFCRLSVTQPSRLKEIPFMSATTNRARPSRSPRLRGRPAVVMAILSLLAVLGYIGWQILARAEEQFRGRFRAGDYAWVLKAEGSRLDFMPRSLPNGATDVQIVAEGIAMGNFLPAPDHPVSVRFRVPLADIPAMIASARAQAAAFEQSIGKERYQEFVKDPVAAPATTRFLLTAPGGMNNGGVEFNPQTGEVKYWYLEY
jgi:hypothetical protein